MAFSQIFTSVNKLKLLPALKKYFSNNYYFSRKIDACKEKNTRWSIILTNWIQYVVCCFYELISRVQSSLKTRLPYVGQGSSTALAQKFFISFLNLDELFLSQLLEFLAEMRDLIRVISLSGSTIGNVNFLGAGSGLYSENFIRVFEIGLSFRFRSWVSFFFFETAGPIRPSIIILISLWELSPARIKSLAAFPASGNRQKLPKGKRRQASP